MITSLRHKASGRVRAARNGSRPRAVITLKVGVPFTPPLLPLMKSSRTPLHMRQPALETERRRVLRHALIIKSVLVNDPRCQQMCKTFK
jgi:hypothetical protein